MNEPIIGFDSFRLKLFAARPELALIERFLPDAQKTRVIAFECLLHELVDAATRIAEPQVAEAKLAWWFGELDSALLGMPRHPVTRSLLPATVAAPERGSVQTIEHATHAMRHAPGASDTAQQIQLVANWFASLFEWGRHIHLWPAMDVAQAARARAVHQLVRQLVRLGTEGSVHILSLPLNLMARHQLSRADLGEPSSARDSATRDQLKALQGLLVPDLPKDVDLTTRVRCRLDSAMMARAIVADHPCARLVSDLPRLRITAAWQIWNMARRGE
ncbi:MAG: hypothetical protein ABI411_20590 [Tahibacter sp.]